MPTGGKNPTSASLSEVLEGLLEAGVDFILVGGLAAVIQGAPVKTMDVYVVNSQAPQNIDRLLAFLRMPMPFNVEVISDWLNKAVQAIESYPFISIDWPLITFRIFAGSSTTSNAQIPNPKAWFAASLQVFMTSPVGLVLLAAHHWKSACRDFVCGIGFHLKQLNKWRRGWDSNPRSRASGTPVFETDAFSHSATSPCWANPGKQGPKADAAGFKSPNYPF